MYQTRRVKQRDLAGRLIRYFIILAIIAIFFGLVYLLTLSEFSKIQRFIIFGLEENTSPEKFIEEIKPAILKTKLGKILGVENYFAWNSSIKFENSSYESLLISKHLKDRSIVIEAKPRKRFASWCKSSLRAGAEYKNCFWLDESGLAFEEAPILTGQLIFSITEHAQNSNFIAQERILPESEFSYIKTLLKALRESELEIEEISLERDLQELQILTKDNTNIRFSYRFNPKRNVVEAFKRILKDQEIYLYSEFNFTVENRVYFTKKYIKALKEKESQDNALSEEN